MLARDSDTKILGRRIRCWHDLMKSDEAFGVLKRVAAAVVVRQTLGGIASQGENVLNARGRVAVEDRRQLLQRVTDAGQVRDGGEVGFLLDADDQVVGALPGRAPRAIGDRDERGLQAACKMGDIREQVLPMPCRSSGGKNSKLNVVGWAWKMSRMCMSRAFRRSGPG